MKNRIVNRLTEYVIITGLMNVVYLNVTIPWMLLVIQITEEQFWQWLWQGLLLDLGCAYPTGKLLIWMSPKIKRLINEY
jgi:hypothetical protein